jgi:hypothetical protein
MTEQPQASHTDLPWDTGCLCNDTAKCNCAYIFSEGYNGAVGQVFIDNGKKIVDGGNDCPPFDEAKANLAFIVTACNNYDRLERDNEALLKLYKAVNNFYRAGSPSMHDINALFEVYEPICAAIAQAEAV